MKVQEIAAHEADFESRGIDSSGKKFQLTRSSIDIPNSTEKMKYTKLTPISGNKSFYYEEAFTKDQIVLHYTLGFLKGDIATLSRYNNHVSVPFVIGRNGTIYNLFFSGYWSYHLGEGAVRGNKKRSQKTIGIEISNIGGLNLTKDGLVSYYRKVYCELNKKNFFEQKNFRRFSYYAAFTDAQYQSLIVLLRYLTARYNIDRKFLPEQERYTTKQDIVNFKGIVSHVNYRESGKEDIGPAFDWERLIREVRR